MTMKGRLMEEDRTGYGNKKGKEKEVKESEVRKAASQNR